MLFGGVSSSSPQPKIELEKLNVSVLSSLHFALISPNLSNQSPSQDFKLRSAIAIDAQHNEFWNLHISATTVAIMAASIDIYL